MKTLPFFQKIVFIFNSLAAFLLLLSYVLPLVPPNMFSVLAVLSLTVPFFILLNALFFVYWLIKVKKQCLLSLIVLIIGYFLFGSLYKFSEFKVIDSPSSFSVMNYNVRLFNYYKWISEDAVEKKIATLITKKAPDVLCFQEYHPHKNMQLSQYKYKYEKLSGSKVQYGQAIFSNFPIINSGSVDFDDTFNNAIYADIVKGIDTIRIYNIHLQSLRIVPSLNTITTERSNKLVKGVVEAFKMQQDQVTKFLKHKTTCTYKILICGDFNNTAFSYVYKQLKGDFNDVFAEAGNGFGRTYDFKFFPIRIDFILADPAFKIQGFKTYSEHYSDHYPIQAKLDL